MAKKWKSPKSKLLLFQKDLQILLEEYDYVMGCRLVFSTKGIVPQITIATPKSAKQKPAPEQIAKMIEQGKINKDNVKQKEQEQRPDGKGKKSKGKN